MRVQIEHNQCLPQLGFLANSRGFDTRDQFMADCINKELVMGVPELQVCLTDRVFDEDEPVVVLYTQDELMELLRDSAAIFLWTSMPDQLRQTLVIRFVLPITRKMKAFDQAMIFLRHLKMSTHKWADWQQGVNQYLTSTKTTLQSQANLRTLIQTGTLQELVEYSQDNVTYAPNTGVPKVVAAGYVIASFAAIVDKPRSLFWLDLVRDHFDRDLRYLEQILHAMPPITFFRQKDTTRYQEKNDLLQQIGVLEEELHRLRQERVEEVNDFMDVIAALHHKHRVERDNLRSTEGESPLKGKRIAVVGDEIRHPIYRVILEDEGAQAVCVPGFSKIHAGIESFHHVDGVLFVTAYSSHTLYYALKARKRLSTTVLIHQSGMRSFKSGVDELSSIFRSLVR